LLELFFLVEILLKFLTEFFDSDTYKPMWGLKAIAVNYVLHGPFILDLLTVFPFQLFMPTVYPLDGNIALNGLVDEHHALRNLLWLKVFRVKRLGGKLLDSTKLQLIISQFYYKKDKDDQVVFNQHISIIVRSLNNLVYVIGLSYFLGMAWYRFTDYMVDAEEEMT